MIQPIHSNRTKRSLTHWGRWLLLPLMLVLLLSGMKPENAPVPPKPNIIFIMADDMGYSDIGCYGSEIQSPNLDLLAANGVKLRSFYNNARCCPTRASQLTGQYPHTVGMGNMVSMPKAPIQKGCYQGFLNEQFPTIAERLKEAGHQTYMTGKWQVGERQEHWPLKRGFDHYFGLISGDNSYYEIIPQELGKRHVVKDQEDPSWELYHLKLDPTETKDLATKEPARVKSMQAAYAIWCQKVGVQPFVSNGKSA